MVVFFPPFHAEDFFHHILQLSFESSKNKKKSENFKRNVLILGAKEVQYITKNINHGE